MKKMTLLFGALLPLLSAAALFQSCGPGVTAVDTSVSFKRDIQPLFDQPLTGTNNLKTSAGVVVSESGKTANNVSCVFCHSPTTPITGAMASPTPCSEATCGGRSNVTTPAGSAGAGGKITGDSNNSFSSAFASASFPKGLSSGLTTGGVKGVSFANAFDPTTSGYQFSCETVKALLEKDETSKAAMTAPIDPTKSYLYFRLKGVKSTGALGTPMPAYKLTSETTATGETDSRRNAIMFTQDQLDLIARWYNEGGNCFN